MKNTINISILSFVLLSFGVCNLQAQSSSISRSLGLYVFPAEGQDAAQQDADETECFKWAKQQSGYDPMNPTVAVAQDVDRSPDGRAIGGAARGAAGGAAIGAIAGDAGTGAAIGAVVGGVRGRRSKVVGDEMQQQANNQAAAAETKRLAQDYNKAFTACMQGKGYKVQ